MLLCLRHLALCWDEIHKWKMQLEKPWAGGEDPQRADYENTVRWIWELRGVGSLNLRLEYVLVGVSQW